MRALVALLLLSACADTPGTSAMLAIDKPGDDFYALPFPNNLHRNADGTLELSTFPTHSLIVDQYRTVAQQLDGFALNAAMFARFTGPLDETSLPSPADSAKAGASVYVIDVDKASPGYGQRTPVIAHFRADGTDTIKGNRLAVRPYPGFGLDEGTTYALVVTRRVHAMDGAPIEAAPDWRALAGSGGSAAIARAREVYAPLLAWLDEAGDDERADVVTASVFTTQHATFVAPAIRKAIFAGAAPTPANITAGVSSSLFSMWTGSYTAPNFQTGTPPYLNDGGEIQIGADGAAVIQRDEPMRFAVSVPAGPVPAGGFPLCIYQHGTGGDYMSFFDDGTAMRLAQQGIAVISTDQVLHGPRNPTTDPGVSFFNFGNPFAGRDNALQGQADAWSQMRLAGNLTFSDGGGRTIAFDTTHVYFFGHSQGGLTGPGFIAFEPSLSGAVLSGTGGLLYLSMLYKTAPLDFPSLVETIARDSPMDEDNPSLALAQLWIERADGANYAPLMVRKPQTASGAKNIFQTEGFTDTYAPNPAIEAFATAIGGDEVMTADAKPVDGLINLRSRAIDPAPIAGNLDSATAVLAQYKQKAGSDGHFVVFDIPAAQTQSSQFLGTLAKTGKATVVSP